MKAKKSRISISSSQLVKIGEAYLAEYVDVYEMGRLSARSDGEYLLELRNKLLCIRGDLEAHEDDPAVSDYLMREMKLPFANAYYLANKEFWREKVRSCSEIILSRYDVLEAEIKEEPQGFYTDIMLGRIEVNRSLLSRVSELDEKELVMARAIVFNEEHGGLSAEYRRYRPKTLTYRGQQIIMKEVMKHAG